MQQEISDAMKLPPNLTFGQFPITSSQAFHLSPSRLSYALVNIRPLLPGHSLVCPVRRVPRLSQLSNSETADLFLTVKLVSSVLERVYRADALNVAVQDGVEAGQSVNHVHVHIIPRRRGDCEEGKGDEIYERMDGHEGNIGSAWEEFQDLQENRKKREQILQDRTRGGIGKDDAERVNRTEEEMKMEADMLRMEVEKQISIETDKAMATNAANRT